MRDPDVTDFHTQNTSAPITSSTSHSHPASATPSVTEIASFTAPNGGKYGATAIDGTVRIAGYQLFVGGPDALVGGVRVSAADGGLVHEGSTAPYVEVTGVEVISTSTDEAGSTNVVSTSSTVAVGESTGSARASESGSESAASESTGEAAASATGGAAAGATARSKEAVSALAGIAGLLWVFG